MDENDLSKVRILMEHPPRLYLSPEDNYFFLLGWNIAFKAICGDFDAIGDIPVCGHRKVDRWLKDLRQSDPDLAAWLDNWQVSKMPQGEPGRKDE